MISAQSLPPQHAVVRRLSSAELLGDSSEVVEIPGLNVLFLVKPHDLSCTSCCGPEALMLLRIGGSLKIRTRRDAGAIIRRTHFQVAGYQRKPLIEVEVIGRLTPWLYV